jgi:small-conductance mechanosensitive channel
MREAASYPERVLAVPAPNALIMAFGETAIELELRFWIVDAQNGVHNTRARSSMRSGVCFDKRAFRSPTPSGICTCSDLPT